MRRFSVAVLALILGSSFVMMAQATAKGDNILTSRHHAKGINLSGQVSKDGKVFVADDDNTWSVKNLEALKGFEGRYVTVNCRMDPSERAIQILDVLERHLTTWSNSKDSAFRR